MQMGVLHFPVAVLFVAHLLLADFRYSTAILNGKLKNKVPLFLYIFLKNSVLCSPSFN